MSACSSCSSSTSSQNSSNHQSQDIPPAQPTTIASFLPLLSIHRTRNESENDTDNDGNGSEEPPMMLTEQNGGVHRLGNRRQVNLRRMAHANRPTSSMLGNVIDIIDVALNILPDVSDVSPSPADDADQPENEEVRIQLQAQETPDERRQESRPERLPDNEEKSSGS